MGRRDVFTLVGVILCVLVFAGYQFSSSKTSIHELVNSEFRKKVENVDYHDKIDHIEFDDGTEISFIINLFHPKMQPFVEKRFFEFIFPGDSIIKQKDKKWLIVKPSKGSPFVLIF